jgi:hypothetical protein
MTFTWHDILLIVLPFVVSRIIKPEWPAGLKYLITLAFVAAASVAEFYLAVYLVSGVQTTFLEAFSKSFLVIFATYAAVLKFPIPGQTIAARLEERGGVSLPAKVMAVLEAKAQADKKAAEVQQAVEEASKAREVVADAQTEATKAEVEKDKS